MGNMGGPLHTGHVVRRMRNGLKRIVSGGIIGIWQTS